MPRNYTRTTKRKYSQYDLDTALYLVRHGDCEIRAVAESTGVPYSTIRRNVKRSNENSKCVFTPAQESDLKIWIQNLCVSQKKALKQVLGSVSMMAKATEVSMPKQWEGKEEAGIDWWRGFCSRQKFRLPFPTLRCVACKINVKNSEIDFICCSKCNSFACENCINICQSRDLCQKCFESVLL